MTLLLVCVWMHVVMGVSQTVGTTVGTITGIVTDSSGGARPGVAIVVTGDALMGTRTTRSDADGRYAVAALPPGDYAIVFILAGFARERREGVHISLGFTATIHVALQPSAREEVIVTRDAPMIDARSTALGTSFDAAALANLPGSRGLGAILVATPSVHLTAAEVGSTGRGVVGAYGAYGTFGANRPMIEGINVSGVVPAGLSLDYGLFDEVSVGTGAHSVEWPAPGVQMQITTRSGGNRYRGSIYSDVERRQWQSFNIDADQIARGVDGSSAVPARESNRLWSYYDLNAGAGGFIRRNRLWWYGSVRRQEAARQSVRFPVMPLETRLTNYGGKLTGQIAGQHRLIAFGQTTTNDEPTRLDPFGQGGVTVNTALHLSEASTANSHAWGGVWKVEWNGVVRDTLFLEVRAGQWRGSRRERPNGFAPRSEDVTTLIVAGGGRDWQTGGPREQLYAAASYAPAGGAGRHVLKTGVEMARSVSTETWWLGYPGDVLHVLRAGRPSEVYLLQTPSQAENGLRAFAAYASDTWRVHRFTLTFGGRFDRYRVFRPAQQHPAGKFNTESQTFEAVDNVIDWNVFAPRLGLVFDVSGDARTLVKVSAGQYWIPQGQEVGANANPNANQWWRRYAWSDPNGSGQWDEGGIALGARGGTAVESLDPGLSLPYLREVTAFFEREVRTGVAVRTGVVWRGERNQFQRENVNLPAGDFSVPIMVPDPGPDGLPGTPDDGPAVQAWQLTAEALTRVDALNVVRNSAHSASDYWTWELGVTVRADRRWSINAGMVHTWTREQSNVYLGQSVRQYQNAAIPNDFINTDEDGRHSWRIWSARISGTYFGPWDVRVTPFLRHQTGQPFGRTFVAALNYSRTVRILAEPIGTRRQANITIADVRIEKGFRMGNAGRLAGFLDVFNLFNANPENPSWSSGTFLRPLSIVAPRLARIGVKFDW